MDGEKVSDLGIFFNAIRAYWYFDFRWGPAGAEAAAFSPRLFTGERCGAHSIPLMENHPENSLLGMSPWRANGIDRGLLDVGNRSSRVHQFEGFFFLIIDKRLQMGVSHWFLWEFCGNHRFRVNVHSSRLYVSGQHNMMKICEVEIKIHVFVSGNFKSVVYICTQPFIAYFVENL